MTKKTVLLICTIFYTHGTFADPQPLTPRETSIYNEVMKKYEQNTNISRKQIDQFRKEKNLSLLELDAILNKKQSVLDKEWAELYPVVFPNKPLHVDSFQTGMAFLLSTIGFFFASPIVATGLAIKSYMTPSPIQKIISSGLIGTGAIIASYTPIVYGSAFIGSKLSERLSNIYESITHKQQNAKMRLQALEDEKKQNNNFMHYLESLY